MEPAEGSDEFLAPGDVARMLCVSPRTVSRWADQGLIPHMVTLGGHRRFRRSDVEKLRAVAHGKIAHPGNERSA